VKRFVSWRRGLNLSPGQLYGWPDSIVDWAETSACGGCIVRKLDNEHDDESGEAG
jgi:hypothetical protein